MLDRHIDTCRHRDRDTRQNPDPHNGQTESMDRHTDTCRHRDGVTKQHPDSHDRHRHTTVRHRNRVTRQHSDSHNRQTEDRRHRKHEAKFQSGCALA